MLRKLFYCSSAGNNEYALTEDSSGFPELTAQLDLVESRLMEVVTEVRRHIHAANDLVLSGRALRTLSLSEGSSPETEEDEFVRQLEGFEDSTTSPLLKLLDSIPHLRVRSDHRNCAMSLTHQYQRKMDHLQAEKAVKTSRFRRNCAKLNAASTRFKDLDLKVRADMQKLFEEEKKLTRDALSVKVLYLQKLVRMQLDTEASLIKKQVADQTKDDGREPCRSPKCDKYLNDRAISEETVDLEVGVCPSPSIDDAGSPKGGALRSPKEPSPKSRVMPQHVLDEDRSVCPRRKHVYGTSTWKLHQHIKMTMADGFDLSECIQLPDGTPIEEWIAVHVIDFFNEISLLYGTISELCTPTTCPEMTAGPRYTYLWADGVDQIIPVSIPAPEYVAKLLEWIDLQVNNPELFPVDGEHHEVRGFMSIAKTILKRLFRVYAHIYHSHLQNYAMLEAETHLNFCFKRFVLFVREYRLIDPKELNALRVLIHRIVGQPH